MVNEYTRWWKVEVLFKNGETVKLVVKKRSRNKHSLGIEELDDERTLYKICDDDGNIKLHAHTSEIAAISARISNEDVQKVKNPYYKEEKE